MNKIAGLLFLIFFALKVAGVSTMSWLGVFSPLIVWAIIFTVIFLNLWGKDRRRRSRYTGRSRFY